MEKRNAACSQGRQEKEIGNEGSYCGRGLEGKVEEVSRRLSSLGDTQT